MLGFVKKFASGERSLLRRAATKFQPTFDPFTYTQGRWLDRDKDRQDARRLHFDFDALLDVAIRCSPGARRVIHCEKKEGGFNRVFMIHLDNKNTVVARLPTRIAGTPRLTTSSEVATLQYVKEKTTIPVPNVLAWSAELGNNVGTEYMILDAMPGVPLNHVWNDMKASQHLACIRSVGRLCEQLYRLEFPAYGSLYFNSDAPPGALRLDDVFCVGPVCGPQHWNRAIHNAAGAEQTGLFQGPWRNVEDYFSDHIARARASAPLDPINPAHDEVMNKLEQLLRTLVTQESIKSASEPTLFHPDLYTRNIFVDAEDHTQIVGIIDWQSTAIEPAFVAAAGTPDFAEEIHEEDHKDCTAEEKAINAKTRADANFCAQMWAVIKQSSEKLGSAYLLDPAIINILAAPSVGWVDNSTAVDYLLYTLSQKWERLGVPGPIPHQHSAAEDMPEHLDEYEARRQLQEHLVRDLRCDADGWVPSERWEEVLPRYLSEYHRCVRCVIESGDCKTEEDIALATAKANRMWPYDQR